MPPLLATQEPDPSFRFLIFPDRVLLLLSPGTGKRFYQEFPGRRHEDREHCTFLFPSPEAPGLS